MGKRLSGNVDLEGTLKLELEQIAGAFADVFGVEAFLGGRISFETTAIELVQFGHTCLHDSLRLFFLILFSLPRVDGLGLHEGVS